MKIAFLIFLAFVSISHGAFTVLAPGGIRPIPPVEVFKNQICSQTCIDGVLKINFQLVGETTNEKKCPSQAVAPDLTFSCGGYHCSGDGKNCLVVCDSNENCSSGYVCENRKCIPERPVSYFCSNQETVASSRGETWNCSPMICQAGSCKDKCITTNDCVPGAVCDTSNGRCVYVR